MVLTATLEKVNGQDSSINRAVLFIKLKNTGASTLKQRPIQFGPSKKTSAKISGVQKISNDLSGGLKMTTNDPTIATALFWRSLIRRCSRCEEVIPEGAIHFGWTDSNMVICEECY